MRLYAVRDRLAGEFDVPYGSKTDQTALRAFRNSLIKFPHAKIEDYEVYYVGDFDEKTGVFSLSLAYPLVVVEEVSVDESLPNKSLQVPVKTKG